MKNLRNVKQRDYYLPQKIMMGIKHTQKMCLECL